MTRAEASGETSSTAARDEKQAATQLLPSGTFNGPDAVAGEVFAPIEANFDDYSVQPTGFK